MSDELIEKISKLKKEKKAVVLAHNYQRSEIQDVADAVGDSIELSRRAVEIDAKLVVFSAVDFMAQSAAILNPDKEVVIPRAGARCPMAQMLTPEVVEAYRRRYPSLPLVVYVNSLAETKALADICCTSANAVKVVESLNSDRVLFGPDRNLAEYVASRTGKEVIPVPEWGFCPVHVMYDSKCVEEARAAHPDAVFMAHPECPPEVLEKADYVGSTSQMVRYAKQSSALKFVVATEVGLLHRLRKENPSKRFFPAVEDALCVNMKANRLLDVVECLAGGGHRVVVEPKVAERARKALEKMFEVS